MWALVALGALLTLTSIASGSGDFMPTRMGAFVWGTVASFMDALVIRSYRHGKKIFSPLSAVAIFVTIIAVAATILGGN
jgi:hypothetical protein